MTRSKEFDNIEDALNYALINKGVQRNELADKLFVCRTKLWQMLNGKHDLVKQLNQLFEELDIKLIARK